MGRYRLTVALLLLSFRALCDQLTLKNGDRVTGEIIKKDAKAVTVKSAFFGTVSVPWEQVTSLKSDEPLTVVLKDGEELKATLLPKEGSLELREQRRTVENAQVAAIRNRAEQNTFERLQHPAIWNLWSGTGSFGVAGTTGNSDTRVLNGSVSAARVTRKDKTTLHFDAIKSTSVTNHLKSDTARAIRGGLGYDRNVSARLFANFFNDYEYDKFQNLDLRATFGTGFGRHMWRSDRGFFDLLAGADYSRTRFGTAATAPSFVRSSGELFWGDSFNFKLRAATGLTETLRVYHDVTRGGSSRVNGDIGLNTRILKGLNWNIALSDRYLSHPDAGRKTNDLVYTTGLGLTFSLK